MADRKTLLSLLDDAQRRRRRWALAGRRGVRLSRWSYGRLRDSAFQLARALWERSVSVGLGYHTLKGRAVLGVGLNWSRPSEDTLGADLDDQYIAEIYFRWQVLKILTITPDVQFLFDPALNPDENVIAVFGIRARINL